MKSSRVLMVLGLALAGVSLFFSGCASAPQAGSYSLKFELAPSLVGSSIQIDLIGANALSDLPKWQAASVTDYWQPDSAMRRDAEKAVVTFGAGKGNVQTFSSNDPIWKRWLSTGAMYLVVIVDLPGSYSDKEGNVDPRRLILPLDVRKWPSDAKSLDLQVLGSGIKLLTPMKAN